MKPLKIFFIIWTYNKGVGGHYQSFISTLQAMDQKIISPFVINIGNSPAASLSSVELNFPHKFLKANLLFLDQVKQQLNNICDREKPDYIHCYDYFSYYFIDKCKVPYLLTFPGGKNRNWFPPAQNLMFFSSENFDFYSKNNQFNKSHLFLVKNRVGEISQNNNKIQAIENAYPPNGLKLLKIARIGEYYRNSILNSIVYSDLLKENSIENTLYIIGVSESENIQKEVQESILLSKNRKNIFLINELSYTRKANELLDLADVVLGTGRGVMEALSLKKVVLAPVNNGKAHCLVHQASIDNLEYFNFSERSILDESSLIDNHERCLEIFQNKELLINYKTWAAKVFLDRYSTSELTSKLLKIFKEIAKSSEHLVYPDGIKVKRRIQKTLLAGKIKAILGRV